MCSIISYRALFFYAHFKRCFSILWKHAFIVDANRWNHCTLSVWAHSAAAAYNLCTEGSFFFFFGQHTREGVAVMSNHYCMFNPWQPHVYICPLAVICVCVHYYLYQWCSCNNYCRLFLKDCLWICLKLAYLLQMSLWNKDFKKALIFSFTGLHQSSLLW